MNSQALQKRIREGNLNSHRPAGEWPLSEVRPSMGYDADEDDSAGATDARRPESSGSTMPDQRIEILRQAHAGFWGLRQTRITRRAVRSTQAG